MTLIITSDGNCRSQERRCKALMNADAITWHLVCNQNEIEEEDVVRFDLNGKTYAVYHTPSGYYATDGLCTHEQACLADGLVEGDAVICPKHNSRFHIPSGKVLRIPAKV